MFMRRLLTRSPRATPPAGRGLRLEVLEARTVPATVHWINSAGGDWGTAGNWSTGHVPGPDDDVILDVTATPTITHSAGTDTIHSLTSAGNNTLVVTGSTISLLTTSTLNGPLSLTNAQFGGGGTISGPGDLNIDGGLSWVSGYMVGPGQTFLNSNATLSGNTDTFFNPRGLAGRTLNNSATATWTEAGALIIRSGGVWNNLAGSTFLIQGDATLDSSSVFQSPGRFNNAGLLQKMGSSGTTTIGLAVNNTGVVDVETGTLSLGGSPNSSGSAASSGAYTVAAGATLGFSGNTDLFPASSVSGDGNVTFTGGTTYEQGSYAITGNTLVAGGTVNFENDLHLPQLTLSSGALSGAGTVTVDGPLSWTGGSMTGPGTTVANAAVTINNATNVTLSLGHTFRNTLSTTWTGAGNIVLSDGSTFTNLPNALFDIQGTGSIADGYFFGPSSYFDNQGNLIKATGTGTTNVSTYFSNSGIVDLETGTLSVTSGPLYNTGFLWLGSGGTLNVSGGLFILNGSALAGSGTVVANVTNSGMVDPGGDGSPGTLTITGSFTQTIDGMLSIDLGGTTVGTQYDQLNVSGAVNLDGTLLVQLINGFTPAPGDTFRVLVFGSRTGDFAAVVLPDPGSGESLTSMYTTTSLTVVTHGNASLNPSDVGGVNGLDNTISSMPFISNSSANDYSAILEFNASAFAGRMVSAARVAGTIAVNNAFDTGPRTMAIEIFAGHAGVQAGDFSVTAREVGEVTYHPPMESSVDFNFDISGVVQQLLAGGATYIGVRVRGVNNPQFPSVVETFINPPTLTLTV
jgi:hypothetical protein